MADTTDTNRLLQDLLIQASRGDMSALGLLLDYHRGYLRALALRELASDLYARLDASDLVQQTCLSAIRAFPQFQKHANGEFVAWLRSIHERNIRDAIREHALTA